MHDQFDIDALVNDSTADHLAGDEQPGSQGLAQWLLTIPVTLALQVGQVEITLSQLSQLEQGQILRLNKQASEPLSLLVNGTAIGEAEVVVNGDAYGLRILSIQPLDLARLSQ